MKDFVTYIVGDENIELGALVAFHSFNKFNPNIDMKLYTYKDKIKKEFKEEFEKIGVEIIDITQYLKYVDIFEVHSDNELKWSQEAFINYYIPELLSKEYNYSIKLDYDLLTINRINFENILPQNQILLSSIYDTLNFREIAGEDIDFYRQTYKVSKRHANKIGINTGFIVFNNKLYAQEKIFNRLKELYLEIKELNEEAFKKIYGDQGLLLTLLAVESIPYKIIPNGYNVTTRTFQDLKYSDKIYNLHFIGEIKPWKKFESNNEISINSYANIFMSYYWLKYVNENLCEFKKYFESDFDDLLIKVSSNLIQSQNKYKKEKEFYKKESANYKKEREVYKKQKEAYKKESMTYKKEKEAYKKEKNIYKRKSERLENMINNSRYYKIKKKIFGGKK